MGVQYRIANGPMPTTAAFAAVTTGTSIKTMLQLKPFNIVKIKAWGISFDGAADAAKIKCELIETGTVFGTVTASADADVFKYGGTDQAVASVAGLTMGTSATGYTCTSEGSITAVRNFDLEYVSPAGNYVYQWPLGDEPVCLIGNATRVRVTAPSAVNCYTWIQLEI